MSSRFIPMSRWLPVVLTMAALATACGGGSSLLRVDNAQAAPPVAGSSQLVVSITNSGEGDDVLLGAVTDVADAIEIHETRIENQRASMHQHDEVAIPAGSTVEFRPGGLHLMLVVPDPLLTVGDTFDVTFTFAHHDDVTVTAEIVEFLDLAERVP